MNNLKPINSLYLHFPFCKHLCNYCDFFKSVPSDKSEIESFQKNFIEQYTNLDKWHSDLGYELNTIKNLFLGGGTPSLWGVEGANFLNNFFNTFQLTIADDAEFTMEANPGSFDLEKFQAFSSAGFNRYSIGVQSLNDTMLKTLDRIHRTDDVYQILEIFSQNQANFSLDLMIGLPKINGERDIGEELNELLKFNPKHFSVYILTIKDNYPYELPHDDEIVEEYFEVSKILKSHGYNHYEVSNYAKPGYESKHNLEYWKTQTVAALGPSATGLLVPDRIRYKWNGKFSNWDKETLSEQEFLLEKTYMALRNFKGWNYFEDIDHTKLTILEAVLSKWEEGHYLASWDKSKGNISLNSNGYIVLDYLMDQLFQFDLLA